MVEEHPASVLFVGDVRVFNPQRRSAFDALGEGTRDAEYP